MYSTCLFCTKDLGTNEVIETLPVGRRIAFDAAQGRLWVVCRHCAKWNLVPFETRLESIDEGERLFRDTKTRFSTENIGIARLKEGLELVRVGPALRPEFAAWRYGDQFGKRRRRALLLGTAIGLAGVGVIAGGVSAGIGMGLMPQLPQLYRLGQYVVRGREVIVRVPRETGPPIELNRGFAERANFEWLKTGGWGIRTDILSDGYFRPKRNNIAGEHLIVGTEAEQVLAGILAYSNELTGSRPAVQRAVSLVEERGDLSSLMTVIKQPSKFTRHALVTQLDKTWRLATEMALHEHSEREALAGELALLEWQWKEADRLAKISDELALPESKGSDQQG